MIAEILIPIFIITILVVLNGVFVSAEFAIVAAPKTKIAQRAEQGSSAARGVLGLLNNPNKQNRYFTTAQVGITIVSLALGMYGEHVLAEWILGIIENILPRAEAVAHTAATILAISLLTYFHVVLGEMIPKSLALQASERTVLALYHPMVVLEKLFLPFVFTLNALGVRITNMLGISQADTAERLVTPDDLEYIVEESFEGGLLEPTDQLFIENILDLEERSADQVMTPRNHICALAVKIDRKAALATICDTTKTRYPVFDETLDKIIGVLHIKDLARIIAQHDESSLNFKELVRPALFIPESYPLDELLIRFRNEHHQIAIVLDEFGGTAGLVTLEDLVEEVVGEIQDEFDQEKNPIEELSEQLIRVQGNVILGELSQHFDLKFESTEANTIGGLVMSLSGEIPKINDEVRYKNIRIVVESIDGMAVETVLIYLPPPAGQT